ncbi:hypothetical protein [Sporisorium scitamineum]|uniref:Uncharacterized protein n=1 Tax=Sporisorium scitamineum TaxID=49012 RepID=A0A0F7SCH1_9BASI|nr:hypothetical protein [Sporisorium scitamineum]
MYKAAFTLSFACFLCSSKVIWDQHSDPVMVLHISNIEMSANHTTVTLPASKTDPFCLGIKVVAPLVGGPKCPISHLQCLLANCSASSPLFGLGMSGFDPFPHMSFVAVLHRAIVATGLVPAAYTGHSF